MSETDPLKGLNKGLNKGLKGSDKLEGRPPLVDQPERAQLSRRALLKGLQHLGALALSATSPASLFRGDWGGAWWAEGSAAPRRAPSMSSAESQRPLALWGVMSGEVSAGRAVIWSRADRPSRFKLTWSLEPDFKVSYASLEALALPEHDLTARLTLTGLPAGRRVFYRAHFESLLHPGARSAPLYGELSTPPSDLSLPVRFGWSGDSFGQGYGINPQAGGVLLYEATRREGLDLFIHCGDRIYADQPLKPMKGVVGGRRWYNLLTPEVERVAQTLDDFRGYYRYTLLDEPTKRFYQVCPQYFMWDDHEVHNDWFPGEQLSASKYQERDVNTLARRSRRAFFEYSPFPTGWLKAPRLYRQVSYGPALDVFLLDGRSHRGPNERGVQLDERLGPLTRMFGETQLEWLKRSLSASKALWKVIACPQPLAVMIGSKRGGFDGFSSGSNAPTGRELELLELLKYIKEARVKGVVWVSADVHYAAAYHFHPERAHTQEFNAFWEFVAGPINAATLGPKRLDPTFGPQVEFLSVKDSLRRGLSPLDQQQFYGMGEVDPMTQQLHISLHNLTGEVIYQRTLSPS